MKSGKLFILCINQSKLLKKYTITYLSRYNNIIKTDTIFITSENTKTSEPHVLTLKLTNKLDLRIGQKITALSNLSAIAINLKYLHQYGMINLNCLMNHILYQIFKIILNTF